MCCPSNRTNLACIVRFASVRTVKDHHDDQNDRPRAPTGMTQVDHDHQQATRKPPEAPGDHEGPRWSACFSPGTGPGINTKAQMLSPALAGFRRSRERGQNASPKYSNHDFPPLELSGGIPKGDEKNYLPPAPRLGQLGGCGKKHSCDSRCPKLVHALGV